MELKLEKQMIERTLSEEGIEVDNTVSVDYLILKDATQVGTANISQYGVNINLYGENYEIDEWKTKIETLITK